MDSRKQYKVYFEDGAFKEFGKLSKADRDKFAGPVQQLKSDPRHNSDVVRNVKSELTMYKHRVGDFRMFFVLDPKLKQVVVLAIRHRDSDTYDPGVLKNISKLYRGPQPR